jgi:predicted dehydrogenase
MYQDAVNKTYAEHCEMVGYCDNNAGRLKLAQERAREQTGKDVPLYDAKDFDRMVREQKPDVVIVTTKDSTHDHYIIRAMELGCDVMTEKPMTTDEKKCQAILKAQQRTGRKCIVAFNYRYSPHRTQVKDLLMSGTIGDVLSVDFHWLLDTVHGADYFRRWHANKANSGGLMVHKATHHFDLVNWWLSANPVTVQANGKRDFYTPQMAKRLGLQSHHERCHTCPQKTKCTFFLDLAGNPNFKRMYLDQEKYDGYFRDRCVFRPDIDIEDTMNVSVKYDTGATLSYSLNAFQWLGRLPHRVQWYQRPARTWHSGEGHGFRRRQHARRGKTRWHVHPGVSDARAGLRSHALARGRRVVMVAATRSCLTICSSRRKVADKYLRAADQRGGAYSILTGIAANHSIRSGKTVAIADLVRGIGWPEYPAMPNHTDPVPMPPKNEA